MFEIRRYRRQSGTEPITEWLTDLADRQAQARILARIERLEVGNFGDSKFLRDGVSELRIDWGPGYRVYYGRDGGSIILLLCGGDKRKQSPDIEKAIKLWREYLTEKARNPAAIRQPYRIGKN
ncbi:MAG: type II toxin-antitoxin system RelE/ParE family toxin [Burkholderiales bacterium]